MHGRTGTIRRVAAVTAALAAVLAMASGPPAAAEGSGLQLGPGGGLLVALAEPTVQSDYEPVTSTVRGRVGDTVRVRLGVRDLGPDRLTGSEDRGGFKVIPPEGTTVTSIPFMVEEDGGPWACDRPEKPGGAFVCHIGPGGPFTDLLHEGGTTTVDFHIRIDRQVPGAKGTIRTYSLYDFTPGNNLARIPLDASPAPPYRDTGLWVVVLAAVLVLVGLYPHRRRLVAQLSGKHRT